MIYKFWKVIGQIFYVKNVLKNTEMKNLSFLVDRILAVDWVFVF